MLDPEVEPVVPIAVGNLGDGPHRRPRELLVDVPVTEEVALADYEDAVAREDEVALQLPPAAGLRPRDKRLAVPEDPAQPRDDRLHGVVGEEGELHRSRWRIGLVRAVMAAECAQLGCDAAGRFAHGLP